MVHVQGFLGKACLAFVPETLDSCLLLLFADLKTRFKGLGFGLPLILSPPESGSQLMNFSTHKSCNTDPNQRHVFTLVAQLGRQRCGCSERTGGFLQAESRETLVT